MKCYSCETETATEYVLCGGCEHYFCRKHCWRFHLCDFLTTHSGKVVKIGDILMYLDGNKHVYEVTDMPRLYFVGYACLARRRKDGVVGIIRPRLMYHAEE